MANMDDFLRFMTQEKTIDSANRPLRLRLAHPGGISDDLLLPQLVFGSEAVCGGLHYRVLCVATAMTLPLKELIGLPAALDFVTDLGDLRSVCGIVTEASAGDGDGGLASYQLVLRDAFAILEKRINTRVFRNQNELDIVLQLLGEWRQSNAVMAHTFAWEVAEFFHLRTYPRREFTMQHNESDAAFIRRLLQRRGIAWFFRAGTSDKDAGDASMPAHTLVLFNNVDSLRHNAAGSVRYHRDHATEQRGSLTSWSAVRTLQAASVTRHSWDYLHPAGRHFMLSEAHGAVNQGSSGNELAASLDDYIVQMPHAADDHEDHARLGQLRMSRHALESKCFYGEGSPSALCAGEYFTLLDHPEIDTHPAAERDFVVTALTFSAQNNLPKELASRMVQLFMRNRWMQHESVAGQPDDVANGPMRVHVRITAVRRGVAIVPAFDERTDLPRPRLQSALVVGPAGEEVHCDQLGRVRIRFPGTRPEDHRHADGAGAADSEADSAWVRVASAWAGNGTGSLQQCGFVGLPRVGSEVLVDFLGGDPDKPIIVGQLYNQQAQPAALSAAGELPGNRYLSGLKSREVQGGRGNQLRFDDTAQEISAQLSSDHGASQLNLGALTAPRSNGHGVARGEGAELRSDMATVVRGAEGLLLTAAASPACEGKLLDRNELMAIAEGLHKLSGQLAQLAVKHAGDAPPGLELGQLVARLKQLHQEAAPIVAISAPAGMILGSGQHLAMAASGNIDVASSGSTGLAAAAELTLRSATGMSLFAHQDGVKATAASGKVQVQAQTDALELLAQKVLDIISTTDWINIKARQGVRINGGGSELVLSADGIVGSTAGKHHMHASEHQTLGGKNVPAQFPSFDICPSKAKSQAGAGSASIKPE